MGGPPLDRDRGRFFRLLLRLLLVAVAASLLGCTEPDTVPPDLIIADADVHTANPDQPRAEALAVLDGRIVAVGDSETLRELAGAATRVVEAEGRTVVPGLIDAHVHLSAGERLVRGIDLYGVAGLERWLSHIAERVSELPPGTWLVGGRWDHTLNDPPVLPTRHDLDRVTAEHPVALADVDGHSLWANSLALELAGVDAETGDPVGGRVLKDDQGEPTGIFLEASRLVTHAIPALDEAARLDARRDTLRHANSVGITAAHDMAGFDVLDDWRQLASAGELSVRIFYGVVGEVDPSTIAARREVLSQAQSTESGPRLELGFKKLMIDGVLSSRTAAMLEPYADDPSSTGLPHMSQQELNELVASMNAAGLPVAIHSIGDRGVRMSLDAFASVGGATSGLANRIEHNEVIDPDDAGRYRELSVIASMNPHHCITGIDKYNTARLGPERAAWSFPWGRLSQAGATLMFGSDWPTAPLAPLEHLYAAVVREKPGGGPAGGWYAVNRLTWQQALRAYTLAGAEAAGWGDQLGSLEVGKWADFVLLDRRLHDPPGAELEHTQVDETWIAGERVYPRPSSGQ